MVAASAALLALSVAAAAAMAQRLVELDPRPSGCRAGPHPAKADLVLRGALGHYDGAYSEDGCVRVRTVRRFGHTREFLIYELGPDGGERPRIGGSVADDDGWLLPAPPFELPPLPAMAVPTFVTSLTWYGYSDAGEPVERVERSIENRGAAFVERRFFREGGAWHADAPKRYVPPACVVPVKPFAKDNPY